MTHTFPVTPCSPTATYQNALRTIKGHAHCGEAVKTHHIVSTHNLFLINERDTYTKHRCYTYMDECICECVDSPTYVRDLNVGNKPWGGDKTKVLDRFQDGTIAGKRVNVPAGGSVMLAQSSRLGAGGHKLNIRKFTASGHLGRMSGQSVFRAKDKFWKPPSYYVSQEEVEAIKRCCDREEKAGVAWLKSGESCTHLKGESVAQIKERLAELPTTITNSKVVAWLSSNSCGPAQYGQQKSISGNGKSGYNHNNDGTGIDYDVNDRHHTGGESRNTEIHAIRAKADTQYPEDSSEYPTARPNYSLGGR